MEKILNHKRAKDHGFFDHNPFKPEGIVVTDAWKGGESSEVTDMNTGEISTLISSKEKYQRIEDTKVFVKTYDDFWEVFGDLSIPGIKLLRYIKKCMVPNKDQILVNVEEAVADMGYKGNPMYYRGLNDLLNYRILARVSGADTRFFLNVNMLFNGNRAKL